MWSDSPNNISETRNQAGCPYLNQIGADAVLNWANILASIDRLLLPENLQIELQQLLFEAGLRELAATAC
jgi:hypothetical protein